MSDIDVIQTPASTIVSIVASVGAICGPIVMAWLVNRNARLMKAADYARQDVVAERLAARQDKAERIAAEVAAHAATTADLLVDSNTKLENDSKSNGAKLGQIHALVNSSLTASMEDQLDARRANLVLLKQVQELTAAMGRKEDPDAAGIIAATEAKIAELSAQVRDRNRQTVEAEKRLALDVARSKSKA